MAGVATNRRRLLIGSLALVLLSVFLAFARVPLAISVTVQAFGLAGLFLWAATARESVRERVGIGLSFACLVFAILLWVVEVYWFAYGLIVLGLLIALLTLLKRPRKGRPKRFSAGSGAR